MPYWRGKSILHLGVRWIMLATAVQFAFYANPLLANPTGASVVNGAVNMQTSGNTLAITASDRSIINWQGFSIGAGETTQFIQPTVNASVLNRVTSGDASQIMGALQANGQVYLINPNGIFIGNGATINVGSFLASTANVTDESFMRGGNLTFSEASGAGIINRGTITANHGDVFLLAKTVENSGTIQAAQGTVGLMAGTQFFLKKDETGAVKVKVDSSSVLGVKAGTGVANSGVIEAMQAQLEAQGNVYALAINQSGIIRATGVSRDASGTIVLSAPGGMIRNTGTMLALNRDGSGGRLSVSGGDIMTDVSSIMTAAGTGVSDLAMGGQIEISAENDAIVSGRLDVSAGDGAKGGRLVVTGERVGLFAGKVDASGGTGGGEVLLGGDYQGLNPLVRNAETMVMTLDSSITADATISGDGGKVILWSDDYTGFYGDISAKGGVVSGNGGFVETSSKENLQAFGLVNASAVNGQGGEWLLDPFSLTISSSATSNAGASPNFVAAANDAVVQSGPTASAGSISAGLSAGTSITVSTGNVAGSQAGNITVTGAIGKTAGTAATLTLNANGSIDIQSGGAISSTTGTLGLILNAGFANGGDTTVVSTSSVTIGDTIGLNGGILTINSVGTGSITLNANIGGATTAAVATANLTSGGAITQTSGVFTATGTTTLAAGSAQAINLSTGGTPNNFGTVVVTSGGAVTLSEADTITFGAVTASGNFNLVSGGAATFNNAVNLGQTGGSFNATITGAANVNNTITANGVTISPTGVLTINSAGTILSGGAVSLGGSSISTGANVTTTADAVTYLANTTLTAPGIVVNSAGGDITFSGTLLGAQSLGLTAGAGNILFSGVVGATPLTTVTINSANNVTASGAFSAANLSLVSLTGSAIFNGNLNLTSGLATTAGAYDISILGATQTIAGATTFNNTGTLTLGDGGDTINFTGGVVATAPSSKAINGTITAAGTGVINLGTTSVTVGGNTTVGGTSTGAITLGNAVLADSVTLTIGTGVANSVTLGSVTGTAGGAVSNLTINTTGAVSLNGVVGTDIGTVTVSSSGSTAVNQSITSIGNIGITSAGVINLNQGLNTTGTGTVTLNATGNLVIVAAGDINSNGAVSLSGAQIQTAGDVGTSATNITFSSATLLTGDVLLDTGSSAGNILFSSTLNGGFDLGLTAGTGNITFSQAVGGTTPLAAISINSAAITLVSSTLVADSLVQSAGSTSTTLTDNVTLNGAAGLNLTSASIVLDGLTISALTGNGVVRFNGPTVLNDNVTITRGSGAVSFTGTLLSQASGAKTLTLNGAGGGAVTFGGAVGGTTTQELGAILISTASDMTALAISAASLTQTTGTGTTTFNGAQTYTAASGANISNTAITLNNSLTSTSGAATVSLNSTSGSLTIDAAGDITSQGTVTLTGSSGISTGGNVTTSDDSITFASNTTFTGPIALSSNTGPGNILFSGTLNGANALSITAGTGDITFSGAVVVTSALGAISLVSGQNLTGAAISATSLVGTALTGNVSLTGAQIYSGAAGLNLVTSGGTIILANAATVTANSGILTLNSSGAMTIGTGAISTGDVVNLTAGGGITTSANITTINDNINFNSATSLGGPVILNTGTGIGDITFANNLTGTQNLGLTAGTGNITFTGVVGAAPLSAVTINSGNNVTASAAFSAASVSLPALTGTASFAGNLTLTTGLTTTAGAYAISMTGPNNTIAGITTFNNTGALTLGNGGDTLAFTGGVTATAPSSKAINGTITAAGTGVINLGTTPVTVGGNTAVGGTSTGAITLGNATLSDGVTLTIGTGVANTISLGSITGTAAGAVSNLTLNTTGAVTVSGAVGTDIGTITITQSGGVAFQSTVTANTVTISNSTLGANVDFQDNLIVNTGMSAAGGTAAYDILITGSSNSIAGTTTFSNTGQLTIGNAFNDVSVFTGGLTATTQSAGFGAGFVRTAGGVVDLGAVTLTAATTIDTTNDGAVAAGADLTLVDALGGLDLTLISGTAGTVDLAGATVANLTVTADEIDFSGGASTITSTGAVILQGATAATTIGVGGGAGTLQIDDTDLAAIANGATSITIGQALQTGLVTVDTSAFRDPVTIRSSGTLGEVQVDGLITATGATTSVTLEGATLDLNAGIDTAGGAVTLTGGIGGVDLAVAQTIDTAAGANSGTDSGDVSITATGTGTITLAGDLLTTGASNNAGDGSAGGAITITGVNGNVSITGNISALGGASSAGAGGAGGDLSITTTTGAIGLANIDTSGGVSSLNNSDGGDAGAITINSSGGLSVTLNSSTISASGGAAGGGTGLAGDGANITFDNPVILAGASTISTTGNIGGDIAFNDTVSGTFDLTMAAGNGDITFAGDAGSGVLDPLGIVTVNSVNTFISSSTFEAAQFVLAAAPLTSVTFSGGLNLSTSLTTIAGLYGFSITGALNSIAGDTNFLNQGALVLGNDALDVLTFVGGLGTTGNVTNPSSVSLAGTINTTNTQMDLGAVTLTAATTLDTGNSAVGVLNVGAVTSGGNSLTLDSGSTAGATIGLTSMANLAGGLTIRDAGGLATIGALGSGTAGALTITDSTSGVTFNSTVNATSVTLTDTDNGATVTFSGNLTATSLAAVANGSYNVEILGALNTVTGATTLANTGGSVTLATGGATSDFRGGITATVPATVNIGGTVTSNANLINLGSVNLTANSVIDSSGGGVIGGVITLASIVGNTFDLALRSRTQNTTVSGNATGLGTLTLQSDVASATGSMIFNGNLVANTLTTFSRAYAVQLNGAANSITTATTFNNLGALTIGQAAGSSTFTGGLVATANSSRTLNGTITTVDTAINLGTVTLGSAVTLDTGNAATGTMILGNVTATSDSLTLDSGSTAGATISMGTMTDLSGGLTIRDAGGLATIGALGSGAAGALTVTDSTSGVTFSGTVSATTVTLTDTDNGATITFSGNLTATSLTAAANGSYNVALLGTGTSTISGASTFFNDGTLTLGSSGTSILQFNSGINTVSGANGPSVVLAASQITATSGNIILGSVANGKTVTVNNSVSIGGTSTGTITLANTTLANGVTLTVGTGSSSAVTLAGVTDGANTGNLVVTSNVMTFGGGANSIDLAGTVLLQGNAAATTIGIGTGALATDLDLAPSLFNGAGAVFADGISSITIGQSAQTGQVTVFDAVTFRDSVLIRSSGTLGEVQVDGLITATGATTSVTLQGATLDLNAGITTAGGAVTLTGGIGGVDLAAAQTILTTAAAGTASGAVAVTATGAGAINLAGAITTTGADNNLGAGSAGGNVTITGATGTVTVSGAVTATGGAGTRAFVAGGENGGAGGDIAISATTGNVSVTGAVKTLGGSATNGEGGMGGDLALSTTTGTIGLGDITTSGGTSSATNFDGGDAGAITLSSTGGSAVTLNNSTISALGGTAGGGIGVAGNGAAITFNNPVLLATGAASINTTGANGGNITFNSTVNSSSSLTPQSMTLDAGTGTQAGTVTFANFVGTTAALTDLDVTAKTIQLNTTSISVDAGPGGNTVDLTGAVTLGANVSLDLDGALGNNSVAVTGTVDSASSLVPQNLTVLAGASTDGTLGNVTVTGAVGGTAPLANITVTGAGTLTAGTAATDNVTFTGDLTATANEMFFNGTEVRSTGGGTITLAPTTLGNGILVTGTTPLLPPANTLVLDTLSSIYTSGRLVIGSSTSEAVTVEGAVDLSSTGYTGFSLLSGDATATFKANSVLTLPTATDILFDLGTGDVDGTDELDQSYTASLSPSLVATGGTLRFVSVGSVSLYGDVENLLASTSTDALGGLVYLNEGSLNVRGNQTAAGEMLIGSLEGDLNLSAQLTGTKITAYADGNFNNTFGSTAINLQGGRGLVYSTNPDNNNPSSANGGLTGFGAAYLVPTPDVVFGAVGTYTIQNAPSGSANLMAYSDPLPVSQLDSATLNQIVQTDAYLAAVPLTGASLPALPRSDVRLGFRMGGPQQRAPVVAPLGQVDKNVGTKGQSAEVVAPGRLKVSQMKRVDENKAVGQAEGRQPMVQPLIRIGVVSLRPSGDYLPLELAEVTMGGIRISQK